MVFGIRAVMEAVDAGKELEKVFIRKDLGGDLARELIEKLRVRTIPVQRVPQEKLNRLTQKNHQGVVAFAASIEYQHIEDIVPLLYEQGRTPLLVLLDGVTDVRNFGAIARTCECAGVDALIVPAVGGAAANADAIKLLNEANPEQKVLALRSLEALAKVANGRATKLIIPSDLQNLAGTVSSIKELLTDPADAENK